MDKPDTDEPRRDAVLTAEDLPRNPTLDDDPELITEQQRVSNRTNIHDEGSGANETPDGLSELEEAVRQAAEDIPTGQDPAGPTESIPVFDRGGLPPKI